ncbi:MAG: ATP-dependent DNA helicase RecG [Chloroflexota bacterium]|nr:ATP-dependent DNA helicase RecG [Chloroflexota bacterium]MDE2885290.1 ATP-dependent DNA helicase RecG [Chloroflexota bacterium]
MTTRRGQRAGASQVRALRNILDLETANGFADKAVAGGLDRFLATLRGQVGADPALKALDERGLLSVAYAEFDATRRERWADEVRRFLGDAGPATRSPKRAAPPPEPPPAAPQARDPLDVPLGALRAVNRTHATAIRNLLVRRGMLAHEGEPTVGDLLYLFPLRHVDRRERTAVGRLRVGEEQTIEAVLWDAYEVRLGRGGRIRATEAVVGDDTGNIRVIWWGNPWIAQQLRKAMAATANTPSGVPRIVLSGKVTLFQGKRQMESPEWELMGSVAASGLHTAGLVPFYPSAITARGRRIPPRRMREIVREALDSTRNGGNLRILDALPDAVREDMGLLTLGQAIERAHYPDSEDAKEQARRRLAFDEFLAIQLRVGMERNYTSSQEGIVLPVFPPLVESFVASLPFELTQGQRDALDEAMRDVSSGGRPMSRLLQGDVGSGKTVVAVAMLLTAIAGGYQGAMMAPTEVLAEQHFLNVRRLFSGPEHSLENPDWFSAALDGRDEPVTVALLTGSTRAPARREILRMAGEGTLDLLIGTHALIQRQVSLPNLALAVGDEQHRFGVLQREALRGKSAVGEPHLLLMSATPIPRTLALTLYGGLEISTMRELPAGRQEILTRNVDLARATDAEHYLLAQVREGRQCFIVYPRIDEADDRFSGDDDDDAAGDEANENSDVVPESAALPPLTAVAEYERLRSTTLADVRVGLLHGRMPLPEKQAVMDAFRAGEIDVLVSTPVIEVGIDVPNATVMMVQSPTRFGLAQLHQLRGRVGRGAHRSYCFLVAESGEETFRRLSEVRQRRVANGDDWREVEQWFRAALAQAESSGKRLDVLVRTNDGFEIAEADLEMRSQGDFFGTRQSGIAPVRMARPDDRDLLDASREHAGRILAADPELRTLTGLRAAVDRLTAAVTDEMA